MRRGLRRIAKCLPQYRRKKSEKRKKNARNQLSLACKEAYGKKRYIQVETMMEAQVMIDVFNENLFPWLRRLKVRCSDSIWNQMKTLLSNAGFSKSRHGIFVRKAKVREDDDDDEAEKQEDDDDDDDDEAQKQEEEDDDEEEVKEQDDDDEEDAEDDDDDEEVEDDDDDDDEDEKAEEDDDDEEVRDDDDDE